MKKQHLAAALLFAVGLGLGLPAQAEPPSWAPAHGHRAREAREYRYVYYPAQQVYYAPQSRSWFWLNGGNWQAGINLPSRFQVNASNGGVSITLDSSRPYVKHVYVEERYGRPWREKHGHGHKHKEKHHEKHHDKHEKHHDKHNKHGHHDH
ncbi:hypothetical protein [Noviherbaspirillum cavernae]|nr:hypothetical protein [Noviherbaspirillum cavernae]